jgi:diguanylate cyclase (GGDEF)-like protein
MGESTLDRLRVELFAAWEEVTLLRAELEATRTRDSLTGALVDREMMRLLAQEVERGRRHGGSTALVLVERDAPRPLNHLEDQLAADEILREVTQLCAGTVRVYDSVARLGDDVLALLLPRTTAAGAMHAAERVRRLVEDHEFYMPGPAGLVAVPLTVSIGVAAVPEHGVTPGDLMNAARFALCEARGRGRNCAVAFGQLHP